MTTTEDVFKDFKEAMSGLEKGLLVIHLTTPSSQLFCCQHDEDVALVLDRSELKQFDQIPVKKGDTIIGLLKRREISDSAIPDAGPVKNYMQLLGEDVLVSADMPLLEFIRQDPLDRLVIRGTQIYGLVTRSDLLKIPARLLGFTLVTHVEALMLHLIHSIVDNKGDTWLNQLDPNTKRGIQKEYKKRPELGMLESTTFFQKNEILEQLGPLDEYGSLLPEQDLIKQLGKIRHLRNAVDHTGHIVDDHNALQTFVDHLRLTRNWIDDIEEWQKKTRS